MKKVFLSAYVKCDPEHLLCLIKVRVLSLRYKARLGEQIVLACIKLRQQWVLSLLVGDIQVFLLHRPSFSFQNIMFYDMGAGSTVCTIVTYQTVKTKDSGTQPQLQIQGIG